MAFEHYVSCNVSERDKEAGGMLAREAIAARRATNHRSPASPACCDWSQSYMAAMSFWACADSSTRKSMLPRELVEELVGGYGATGLHVLVALADGFNGLLVVLAFPFEVLGQGIVECVSHALSSPTRQILQLGQSFRLDGKRFHNILKVEVRRGDVNNTRRRTPRAARVT
jgi:hypothetical protein